MVERDGDWLTFGAFTAFCYTFYWLVVAGSEY